MSSILDALKKLEEEKALRESKAAPDPDDVADELLGRSVLHDRITLKLTPATLLAGLAGFAVLLVAVSVGISMTLLRPDASEALVAAQPTVPTASEIVSVVATAPDVLEAIVPQPTQAVVEDAPATPTQTGDADTASSDKSDGSERSDATETEMPPQATPPAEAAVAAVAPAANVPSNALPSTSVRQEIPQTSPQELAPARTETTASAVEVAPLQPLRNEAPLPMDAREAPVSIAAKSSVLASLDTPELETPAGSPLVPAVALPEPTESKAAIPRESISKDDYPKLTQAIAARYGLQSMRVNFHAKLGDLNPKPSVVINLNQVFEGDRIKLFIGEELRESRARLVRVLDEGIVIEITGTDARYFYEF